MDFADRPLREVLSELAARRPVPGGGASAAWACAIGAGLVEMASAYAELDAIWGEARSLRAEAIDLAERDGADYAPVLAAIRLDRSDPGRDRRIADALSAAADAPLQIALTAARVTELAQVAVRDGKASLRGDAAAGAQIAAGACAAAVGLVEEDIGGREPADPRVARAHAALARARDAGEGSSVL